MPGHWNSDAPTPLLSLTGLRVRINRFHNKLRSHIDVAKVVITDMTQDLYEGLGYLFSGFVALIHGRGL